MVFCPHSTCILVYPIYLNLHMVCILDRKKKKNVLWQLCLRNLIVGNKSHKYFKSVTRSSQAYLPHAIRKLRENTCSKKQNVLNSPTGSLAHLLTPTGSERWFAFWMEKKISIIYYGMLCLRNLIVEIYIFHKYLKSVMETVRHASYLATCLRRWLSRKELPSFCKAFWWHDFTQQNIQM